MVVKETAPPSGCAAGWSDERRREAEAVDAVLSTRSLAMDRKGYFIVRLQAGEDQPIVCEYHSCVTNDKGEVLDPITGEVIPCDGAQYRPPARLLRGRTAKEVSVLLFEALDGADLVCSHAHACYIGRELQKAEECLANGRCYNMD